MTVFQAYQYGIAMLQERDADDAGQDSDLLLAMALQQDKSFRFLHREDLLTAQQEESFRLLLKRRINGEPLQYILGSWSFFGRDFAVGDGVLIPRPETEELVERANVLLQRCTERRPIVFDLCAGSGAIGLTVALENPNCFVYLFEKYDAAFAYLRKNTKVLGVQNVKLIQADITAYSAAALPKANLLLSNPPYIPTAELAGLQPEVQQEPKTALDGGSDGLYFYKVILDRWSPCVCRNGHMLFECGNAQAKTIAELFKGVSREQIVRYDFNTVDRIVEINV